MTRVEKWVMDIVEKYNGPSPFKIGDTVKHPDGRTVRIVAGQYWGEFGISNFWYWREVLEDGSISQKDECGYGWRLDGRSDQKA